MVARDDRILREWRDVLSRRKFGFSQRDTEALLAFLEAEGLPVSPPPLGVDLPDPDDVPFLETAHAAGAILVTGNLKHYPPGSRRGVRVMTPSEFLEAWISAQG